MSAADDIAAAERREAAARARLIATLKELQFRLSPKTIARQGARRITDASQQAAQTGVDTARRYPGPAVGAAAVGVLFLARRRIARLFRRKPAPSPAKDQTDD